MAAQVQPLGDLAVRETINDQRRDLALAGRQGHQRPGRPPGPLAVELEHRDQGAALARQTTRIPAEPASTPARELDLHAAGEAGGVSGGGAVSA
jgi:hypothetical protein